MPSAAEKELPLKRYGDFDIVERKSDGFALAVCVCGAKVEIQERSLDEDFRCPRKNGNDKTKGDGDRPGGDVA